MYMSAFLNLGGGNDLRGARDSAGKKSQINK